MELRDIIIKNVLAMYPALTFVQEFQILLSRIKPNFWNDAITTPTTPRSAVNVTVDRAIMEGWIKPILDAISTNPTNRAELDLIRAQLEAQLPPTTTDPFKEVLLDGNRPFANRAELRFLLKELCAPAGPPLLLIRGDPQTGKSFSFYLAQHIGRQSGFVTSQFEVDTLVNPDQLAAEILRRIGVDVALKKKGVESAQRWAEKLADQVKTAIEDRKQLRLFVFDKFPIAPKPPLPPETNSFIVRLAKYADEELRPWLRVVTIQFSGELPLTIQDVAEQDEARPFSGTDMLAVLKQVANARGWSVSEQALLGEIQQVEGKPLRDRFQFMKRTLRRLASQPAPQPGGPQ